MAAQYWQGILSVHAHGCTLQRVRAGHALTHLYISSVLQGTHYGMLEKLAKAVDILAQQGSQGDVHCQLLHARHVSHSIAEQKVCQCSQEHAHAHVHVHASEHSLGTCRNVARKQDTCRRKKA